MARRYYSSTAVQTTLGGSISNSATSFSVSSLTGFPNQTPWTAIIDADTASEEVVEVTNVVGTTVTVTRGVDGTAAVSHATAASFRHGVSARDFDEANDHVNDSTGVHGLGASSSVVGTSDTQTLTNKTINSASNSLTIAQSAVTNLVSDLAAKADVSNPTFTGTPVAPTAAPGTNTTQVATTAFVQQELRTNGASGGQFRYTGFAWYNGDAATPDSYAALGVLGQDAGALSGNTGYTRQTTGVPVDPQVQSRLRRCVLKNDGTGVAYYLDCDDSTKIAGAYSSSVQTGWVRVHEGVNDPVRPLPGQATTGNAALRVGIPAWSSTAVYAKGDRVLSGGSLWDCLNDGNTNVTPAAGTVSSVLDGTDGQVMVEIPRFYYAETYDPTSGRATYAVACDTAQFKPFPNLTVASTAATSITVGGRDYAVHPAFTKAGSQRPARYIAAYRATATDTGNNGTGTLKSTADGTTVYAGTISRTNFRTKAKNRNAGLSDPSGSADNVWGLVDYHLWHAIQVLFLTEFRSFYAQALIGGGNNSGSDFQKIAGRSNPVGNAIGNYNSSGALVTITTGDTDGVAYRGIEDLYGSQWLWVDGWNVNHDTTGGLHYVSNTPAQFADNTTTNYTQVGGYTPFSGWLYGKAFHPGTLLPAKVGGSTTTYTTDGFYGSTSGSGWRAAFVGGPADAGASGGVASLDVDLTASHTHSAVGAALAR